MAQIILAILAIFDFTLVASTQMTGHRIRDWFISQIEQQKLSPLRFSGRHNEYNAQTLNTQEVLDFEFKATCSEFANLDMFEIRSSNLADEIVMVVRPLDHDAGEEELIQQAIDRLQGIVTLGDSIMFDHVFTNRDGMAASFQRWAGRARYGGRVKFEVESVFGSFGSEHRTSDRLDISIQAVWRYKWNAPRVQSTTRHALPSAPSIRLEPRPMTWDLQIQHAIVDGEKGAISMEDDISLVAPMLKAIKKYALNESLMRQGNFGTSKIHNWGLDEPNGEPPYIGARHFGGPVRTELPPPYSE